MVHTLFFSLSTLPLPSQLCLDGKGLGEDLMGCEACRQKQSAVKERLRTLVAEVAPRLGLVKGRDSNNRANTLTYQLGCFFYQGSTVALVASNKEGYPMAHPQ